VTRLGAEDQVGLQGDDRLEVGLGNGADGLDSVGLEVGGSARDVTGDRRTDRLDTDRDGGVELERLEGHDALRVVGHLGGPAGVLDLVRAAGLGCGIALGRSVVGRASGEEEESAGRGGEERAGAAAGT